jgi:hypothetical protein
MRDAWNSERQAMVVERGTWQKERADHILEREAIAAEQLRRSRIDHENRERQEEDSEALIVWQDLQASTMFAIWDQRILCYAGSCPSWYGSFERMLEEKH